MYLSIPIPSSLSQGESAKKRGCVTTPQPESEPILLPTGSYDTVQSTFLVKIFYFNYVYICAL